MENLKEIIETTVEKIKNDPNFATKFQEEPVKALEEIVGVDLPDDQINGILDTVKAKINFENNDFFGAIKGFFN